MPRASRVRPRSRASPATTMIAVAYPARLRFSLGRPEALAVWVAIQVLAAAAVTIVVIAGVPLRRDIALPWPGLPADLDLVAGLGFWLAFGLIGGVYAHPRPGGSVMTFSMPFIVGGTVLGGPLAGALLGLVAELEVRELRTVPWYGILANHAVSILAAVAAGFVGEVARGPLTQLLPAQAPLAFFLVAGLTALTFAVVNLLLVVRTLALKGHIGFRAALRTTDASFRTTAVAEGVLAWLMAATYLVVGWWATVVCVVLVVIAWQANDRWDDLRHDQLTGLLNDRGFVPLLEAALDDAGAGRRQCALLSFDLNDFWRINDTWGPSAGDQVLRAVARRLSRAVRATDIVCRTNRKGDEFAALLEGIAGVDLARALAYRLRSAVNRPVRLRSTTETVEIQVDVAVGVVMLESGTELTPTWALELGAARREVAKIRGVGVVIDGDGPTLAEIEDHNARKAAMRGHPTLRNGGPREAWTLSSEEGRADDRSGVLAD